MIQTGERAPDFVLPSRGVPTRFYGIAGGRPVALVFCGPESLDLVSRYADGAGPDAAVVAITSAGEDGERAFPVLVDGEGAVRAATMTPDTMNSVCCWRRISVHWTLGVDHRIVQPCSSSPQR